MLSNNANLIFGILINSGASSAQELAARTSLSQPSVSRAINEIAEQTGRIVIHRNGRNVSYAISRQVRGLSVKIPVYQVAPAPDLDSNATSLLGDLIALEGRGYIFIWLKNGLSCLSEGLPWFLQDMRPQGFIGRAFCHTNAERLGLPIRLSEWSDDDVLHAITTFGDDVTGNLIVGTYPMRLFLKKRNPPCFESLTDLTDNFDQLADAAILGEMSESSAAGEHPKFLASYRFSETNVRHVLVKFSPTLDGTAVANRWKDLLIAEHVALIVMGDHGFSVPQTQLIISERRCYLESERFDRVGEHGRLGVVSFDTIDNEFVGSHRNWSQSGTSLYAQNMITSECERDIRRIETFGHLIGNTDMHFGNLSFYWVNDNDKLGNVHLRLAPVYDMLPMLYAPEKGEVPVRTFSPPEEASLHPDLSVSINMAREFWIRLAEHPNLSLDFREIALNNAKIVCGGHG